MLHLRAIPEFHLVPADLRVFLLCANAGQLELQWVQAELLVPRYQQRPTLLAAPQLFYLNQLHLAANDASDGLGLNQLQFQRIRSFVHQLIGKAMKHQRNQEFHL